MEPSEPPSPKAAASSSLSPIFPVSSNPNPNSSPASHNNPQWLSNPSFTVDLSSLPSSSPAAAAAAAAPPFHSSSDDEPAHHPPLPSYDLVGSTTSGSEDNRRRSKREYRKRKKKKRRRERESESERSERKSSRKAGARAWAGSETKPAKDYYFDVRGDRDNLLYGSLYRSKGCGLMASRNRAPF